MIDSGLFGFIQPDAAKWGGHSGCLPVAKAALAAGRTFCPHYLGGAIGLMHSLHLLAAVRGPGLLEVDANANPLREGLLQNLMTVTRRLRFPSRRTGTRSRTGSEAARKPQKPSHRAARVTRGNAMLGLMQDRPLLISQMIDFAAAYYPDVEIVTRTVEGPIHRYGYRDAAKRAKQLAEALQGLGIKLGDRVGTIAWNTYRHFELYFGISGIGAVLHTLNPRLAPEHVAYIANHAEDQVIFVDLNLLPIVEGVCDQLKTVKHVVVMTDRAHMPASSKIPNLLCYEELIADKPGTLEVAGLRREDRLLALLHLGHDRQSEGRALLAPLDRHPFDDDVLGPGARHDAGRRHPAGGADVPRQCLGPGLRRADLRRQAGVPRPEARRRQRLRAARQGAGDPVGRRADGVARPARLLRAEQAQDVVGQAHA